MGNNPYTRAEEVWEDLDNAFGDSDKVATAEMKLASPDFPMKPAETFDHFLTRFTSVTNRITYLSPKAKIRTLRDNITRRLQAKITGIRTSDLKEIINEIRRHDIELRRMNDIKKDATDAKDSRKRKDTNSKDKNNDAPDKRPRNESTDPGYKGKENTKRTKELKDKLIQLGACWRCGHKGHRSRDQNAPCYGKPTLTNEEMKSLLNASPENRASLP